jgi:hypothetical protein
MPRQPVAQSPRSHIAPALSTSFADGNRCLFESIADSCTHPVVLMHGAMNPMSITCGGSQINQESKYRGMGMRRIDNDRDHPKPPCCDPLDMLSFCCRTRSFSMDGVIARLAGDFPDSMLTDVSSHISPLWTMCEHCPLSPHVSSLSITWWISQQASKMHPERHEPRIAQTSVGYLCQPPVVREVSRSTDPYGLHRSGFAGAASCQLMCKFHARTSAYVLMHALDVFWFSAKSDTSYAVEISPGEIVRISRKGALQPHICNRTSQPIPRRGVQMEKGVHSAIGVLDCDSGQLSKACRKQLNAGSSGRG